MMASVRRKQPTKHRKGAADAKLSFSEKKKLFVDSLKASYKKQYDAIQPIPYIKDRLYCVDKVFVGGGIECFAGSVDNNELWKPLESYKDIFKAPRTESVRRIIEGDAGHGKSTLTLQLAYDWCTGVEDSPLNDVDVLILLKLRQFANIKSFYTAINLFLLHGEARLSSRDIKDILEKSKNTKILLDGFDEYPYKDKQSRRDIWRIIQLRMFPTFDVTITSRYLPKCKELTWRAERIKLAGFDEKAQDSYIRKAVTGETNEVAFIKIKQALKDNPILDDLCQVPLFFVTFAHITHEKDDFKKFKSVTDFFVYMMKCFHGHTKKKTHDDNVKTREVKEFESDHSELNKVAFEGLIEENQKITWSKKYLHKRLGQAFYDYYIRVGILVEEDIYEVVDKQHHGDNLRKSKYVRFYHKIFCEWFASFMLADIVADKKNSDEVVKILDMIDPFDLQYVYRFACGINSEAGNSIIEYLKRRKDCYTFAILCIFEQNEDTRESRKAISDLCSELVHVNDNDSKLLQRSNVQLLQIASSHNIPITHLGLNECFGKVDNNSVFLRSGIVIPRLSSLEKITINTLNKICRLTEEDVAGLLQYGVHSESFKQICFHSLILPESIRPDLIPEESKSRNVSVLRTDCARVLDLSTGQWQKCDDVSTIREICSEGFSFYADASTSSQRSVIETMVKASNHNIAINGIYLVESFEKTESANLVLYSGLTLPPVASLHEMAIATEFGREMTLEEVNGILCYVRKSTVFEQLSFLRCLMPPSISLSPNLQSVGTKCVEVLWQPYMFFQQCYHLNIQFGQWHSHSLEKSGNFRLTHEAYAVEVQQFRACYRETPWQQARTLTH